MVKHDVREITLSVKGPTLEDVFSKLALSMFEIVVNANEIDLAVTKTVIIRSRDLKHLLFEFMKRLYDLANNELFILATVKKVVIESVSNEYLLNAVFIGDKMKPNYHIKDIVKQVTDRNILVREDANGASAQINIVVERRNKE